MKDEGYLSNVQTDGADARTSATIKAGKKYTLDTSVKSSIKVDISNLRIYKVVDKSSFFYLHKKNICYEL